MMIASMKRQLRPVGVSLIFFSLLLGGIYPLMVTLMAQTFFTEAAGGSLLRDERGRVTGSALIGQPFSDDAYFWGRPSAIGYDAAVSGGSNLGSNNPALTQAVAERIARLKASDPDNPLPIPVDLVTASGSGLDPHISPAAAEYQLRRIAKARGVKEEQLRQRILQATEAPQYGLFGQPRLSVVHVNRLLDSTR